MTDYASPISPIDWDNRYSRTFCDLLSICAAAQVVFVPAGGGAAQLMLSGLQMRAKRLLTRELVARLNSGSLRIDSTYDNLVQITDNGGQLIADDFATRAAKVPYSFIGGAVARFTLPVPRNGVDVPPEFTQASGIAQYNSELVAVLAASGPLMGDLADEAAKNVAIDPTAAATAAAGRATARANYVTQLQAA